MAKAKRIAAVLVHAINDAAGGGLLGRNWGGATFWRFYAIVRAEMFNAMNAERRRCGRG